MMNLLPVLFVNVLEIALKFIVFFKEIQSGSKLFPKSYWLRPNLEELWLSRYFEGDDLRESIVVQPESGVIRPIFKQYSMNIQPKRVV